MGYHLHSTKSKILLLFKVVCTFFELIKKNLHTSCFSSQKTLCRLIGSSQICPLFSIRYYISYLNSIRNYLTKITYRFEFTSNKPSENSCKMNLYQMFPLKKVQNTSPDDAFLQLKASIRNFPYLTAFTHLSITVTFENCT